MNILKTYTNKLTDENGTEHELRTELRENGGVYGFACRLMPAGQHAEDNGVTECAAAADRIFEVLCREKVLPLNFYSVMDDLHGEINTNIT